MLKIIIGIILVALCGTPFIYGVLFEKNYNAYIKSLNESEYLKGIVEFKGEVSRGLFGAKAVTNITMNGQTIQLLHDIKFGPFILSSSIAPQFGTLGIVTTTLTGEQEKVVQELYMDKQAYRILTTVSMQGAIDTSLIVNPLNVDLGIGVIDWQGFSSRIINNVNDHSFSINMLLPHLNVSEQQQDGMHSVNFTNARLAMNIDAGQGDRKGEFNIDSLKVDSPVTEEKIDVANYTSSFNYDVVNELVNAEVNLKFDKMDTSEVNFGPFVLQANIANMNAEALMELAANQGADPQAGMQSLAKLFVNKIGINVSLAFASSMGNIDIISQTEAGGLTTADVSNPDQMLSSINSTQTLQVSSRLLTMILTKYAEKDITNRALRFYMKNPDTPNPYDLSAENMKAVIDSWISNALQQLTARKYLFTDGDIYMCKIDFANSTLSVNGAAMGPNDLENLNKIFTVIQPAGSAGTPAPTATTTPATGSTTPQAPAPAQTGTKVPAGT